MLLLNSAQMGELCSMRDAMEAQREAFRIYTAGGAQVPLRSAVELPAQQAQLLFMPAAAEEAGAVGIKIVGFFPKNPERGQPMTPATMLLLDPETGALRCVLDGTALTQLRTAAAAGLATELLANPGAQTAALIGLGGQAPRQLEALLTAAPTLREVRVYDIDADRREAFAAQHADRCRLIPVESGDDAVRGAQIVTTVTTATAPLFSFESLSPGVHVNAIGSYTPEMQELPEELVIRCDLLVFDTVHGVMSESGDILRPQAKGLLEHKGLDVEMGHLIAGQVGRKREADITLYKSVGSGVMDVVAAGKIYEKARALKMES